MIALTRVRNEEDIIQDTLDHLSMFCDEIYVLDDCSTDSTYDICNSHRSVSKLIRNKEWSKDRLSAEYQDRQKLYLEAKKNLGVNDWFVYLDADERIDLMDSHFLSHVKDDNDCIAMKLYDFYITEQDENKHYYQRQYIGQEYRVIPIAYRMGATQGWFKKNQRECLMKENSKIVKEGRVKHYGKAISVEEFEKTCDYYIENFPKYADKWKKRKGSAIHTKSDFDTELVLWEWVYKNKGNCIASYV